MTLEEYFEVYKDMLDEAMYFRKIAVKEKSKDMTAACDRVIGLYKEALTAKNTDDAETYYNEIRSEIFECEEILADLDVDEDEL